MVWMTYRIDIIQRFLEPCSIRLIIAALSFFVLHDFALIVELLFRERLGERSHSISFEPERKIQLIRGNLLEILRAIPGGGAVDVGDRSSARSLEQRPQYSLIDIARPVDTYALT